MIRELAKKVDAGFEVGRVHKGESLEDALFRGGSDDGFWGARFRLDLILDKDDFVKDELADEHGDIDEENVRELAMIRFTLSPAEMVTLGELDEILTLLGE